MTGKEETPTIVEGLTTEKVEGGAERVELVEADTDTEPGTDAEVETVVLLIELAETDVSDTGGLRTGVVLVVTRGGTITLVGAAVKVG